MHIYQIQIQYLYGNISFKKKYRIPKKQHEKFRQILRNLSQNIQISVIKSSGNHNSLLYCFFHFNLSTHANVLKYFLFKYIYTSKLLLLKKMSVFTCTYLNCKQFLKMLKFILLNVPKLYQKYRLIFVSKMHTYQYLLQYLYANTFRKRKYRILEKLLICLKILIFQ